MRILLLTLSLLLVNASAFAGTNVTKDIRYGSDPLQALDIYAPTDCGVRKCAVVMWVHGGGWRNGDKAGGQGSEDGTKIGALWAFKGAIVVAVNYRLTPQVVHPAHVQDVAASIDWVNKHIASYGGDTKKIYLLGHSAGAQLIALVATDPQYLNKYRFPITQLAGVFPIDSASYNLEQSVNDPFVGQMVRDAFGTTKSVLQSASPLFNIKFGQRYPAFTMAAVLQRPEAITQMNQMQALLRKVGGSANSIQMDYPGDTQLQAHADIAAALYDLTSPLTRQLMRIVGIL